MTLIKYIILFFISFSAFASDNWELTTDNSNPTSGTFVSSPSSHCLSYNGKPAAGITDGRTYSNATFIGFKDSQGSLTSDPAQYRFASCQYMHPWYVSPRETNYTLSIPCPNLDSSGACQAPVECPAAGTNKLVAFTCDCSGKYCTNPSSFSFEGCGYEKNLVITDINYSTTIKNYSDPANSTCMGVATSTGQPLAPSDGVEELCADCIAEVPKENDEQPSCVTVNAHEFCPDPAHPGCGQRDGQAYCFNETDACGVFGAGEGVVTCIPSSGGRTCSYAKGEYTCIDKTTGKVISSTSSDHPSNGGNADGNDTNDAQAPGAVVTAGGGSAQGSDEGATNKAITDLQGALTDRLDGISDLLGEGEPTAKNINAPTETGSLDLDEWDEKIEQAKVELKQSSEGIGDLMNAANNWIITGSGGSLSCFVEDWGRMCLADYQDQLIGIRYVLIFMASILAIYIIFIRD